MDEFESVEVEISKIKSTQERILDHHKDFKTVLENIRSSIAGINARVSDKESESRERDTIIAQECQSEIKSIYRAVAGFGAASVMSIVGAIIAYLAHK